MALEYNKTSWMNSAGTPLNAESLNHIENGIYNVTNALNELDNSVAKKDDVNDKITDLNNQIMNLDVNDSAQEQQFVTTVSQDNGRIKIGRRAIIVDDLPVNIPQTNITSLVTDLNKINNSITGLHDNLTETNTNFETHSNASTTRFSRLDQLIGVDSTSTDPVTSSLSQRVTSIETTSTNFSNDISGLSDRVSTLENGYVSGILPASSETLGGIMVGTGLHITDTGVLSTNLQPAATDTLGGIKVGTGLQITNDGVLSTNLQPATTNILGCVKVGTGLETDGDGVLSITPATSNELGGVKVGNYLHADGVGRISIDSAFVKSITEHQNDTNNPHHVTKSQLELENVENESVNNMTPDFTKADKLEQLISGEKLSVSFGKIMKLFESFSNSDPVIARKFKTMSYKGLDENTYYYKMIVTKYSSGLVEIDGIMKDSRDWNITNESGNLFDCYDSEIPIPTDDVKINDVIAVSYTFVPSGSYYALIEGGKVGYDENGYVNSLVQPILVRGSALTVPGRISFRLVGR